MHLPRPPLPLRGNVILPLLLLCAGGALHAQTDRPAAPAREIRAVWVTTAAGLDWPRSRNAAAQQESLRAIVRNLRESHFNTIYFQVRTRGDAYYRSAFEPWAENLTGTLGKDPGWDPLGFLLAEARAAGLSVHAWFNVFKINGPGRTSSSVPPHPSRTFPAWTVIYEKEGWLDPGVPEVRSYLVSVAADLVRRYPVDGIHFDFLRYPGADFPDQESYRRFGNGRPKDEWRRENVTRFARTAYDSVRAIRPSIQVGSAPLGVFAAPNGGWGAFATYAQDSRRWLRERIHDYLTPQIYWNMGSSPGDPDFAALAAEWQAEAHGRLIVAGIGAYKDEVRQEIPQQIDLSRRLGMAGQAFFRYAYVADRSVLGGRYDTPALPPALPWRDSTAPGAPGMLAVTESSPGVFTLEWSRARAASDGDTARCYAVYRTSGSGRETLVGITPGGVNFFVDTTRDAPDVRVAYAVTGLDNAWNEGPAAAGSAPFREVADLRGRLTARPGLAALLGDHSTTPGLIAYRLTSPGPAVLEVQTIDTPEVPVVLADRTHEAGTYIVGLSPLRFPPGRYTIRLRTDGTTLEQALILR